MKIAIYGQSVDKISKNIFLEILNISKSQNLELFVEEKYNSVLLKKLKTNHESYRIGATQKHAGTYIKCYGTLIELP